MSWATFRIAAPANCQFANLAGFMHSVDVAPTALLGGLMGFNIVEAATSGEFLLRYLDGHLQRVWRLSLPWYTVPVSPEMTATALAAAIQEVEPRQRQGLLVGISMPLTRVAHRPDIGHELFAGTGAYHYVLRCVHSADSVTTIDATPTRQWPEPFLLEKTDTLDSLLGGAPYELYLNRPWDVVTGLRQRASHPNDLMAHAVGALRADLRERSEGAAPTLRWVARRWSGLSDQPADDVDDYFSPHFNIFKIIAEHRAFLPGLLLAATGGRPEGSGVVSQLAEVQQGYAHLVNLCFKLHFTKSNDHRHMVVAAGRRHLESLIESERQWALATLKVIG